MYRLCKLLRLQVTDARQPAQRRASLHRRVFLPFLCHLFSRPSNLIYPPTRPLLHPITSRTRIPSPDPQLARTRATMEQQAKAPQDLRNVVNYLRSSKAGMKIRVGVLNGKRIDYFKGMSAVATSFVRSMLLQLAGLAALQRASRATGPDLVSHCRLAMPCFFAFIDVLERGSSVISTQEARLSALCRGLGLASVDNRELHAILHCLRCVSAERLAGQYQRTASLIRTHIVRAKLLGCYSLQSMSRTMS